MPIPELDARGKVTLVASLTLILLTLAHQNPTKFNFGGLDFEFGSWLLLAVPLGVAVIYAVVQLNYAWDVEKGRFKFEFAAGESKLLVLEEGLSILQKLQERAENLDDPKVVQKVLDDIRNEKVDSEQALFISHKNELGRMVGLSRKKAAFAYVAPLLVAAFSLGLLIIYAVLEL